MRSDGHEALIRKFRRELHAGVISLVVLAVIERGGHPMYGYEIARRLEEIHGGELPMQSGALYPALRSLETRGLLKSTRKPSPSGPARRYYRPTRAGREALAVYEDAWAETRRLVDDALRGG